MVPSRIPQKEPRRRELSFKVSKKVLENAGILNTLSPSPTMVNIIQRETPLIFPLVQRILDAYAASSLRLPPEESEIDWEADD